MQTGGRVAAAVAARAAGVSARGLSEGGGAKRTTDARSSLRTLAKATLIGRLGREPETMTFEDGRRSLQLSVATNVSERIGDEWTEKAQWHRVHVREGVLGFDYLADLPTGCLVYVEGALRTVVRDTLDGRSTYTNVVVTPREGLFRVLDRQSAPPAEDGDGEPAEPF